MNYAVEMHKSIEDYHWHVFMRDSQPHAVWRNEHARYARKALADAVGFASIQ